MRAVAIIPARGGSRGIPRKNARLLAGVPLLAHTIRAAQGAASVDRVYVSTDDAELEEIASRFGAEVLSRPEALGGDAVGLDEVVADAVRGLKDAGEEFDLVVTIQATCPLLSSASIDRACARCAEEGLDTVVTVTNDTHLAWETDEDGRPVAAFPARLNRQYLTPRFRETGGVVVCPVATLSSGSRFGERVGLLELPKTEAIDIDDYFDWWLAERSLARRRICFHVVGNEATGLGHVYRALTLADRLIDHEVSFLVGAESGLAREMIERRFYPVEQAPVGGELPALVALRPDLVVNDVLDTEREFVLALREAGIRTANFEDLGPGSLVADLVVNSMYDTHPDRGPDGTLAGAPYCCLRDEFYSIERRDLPPEVGEVLLLFGGSDPGGLTLRCLDWLDALTGDWRITVIVGIGHPDPDAVRELATGLGHETEVVFDTKVVSRYMRRADVAVTSAGRTVFELGSLGVPMVAVAQNERETRHDFVRESAGVEYLGLASDLTGDRFREVVAEILGSRILREKMRQGLLRADLLGGVTRVVAALTGLLLRTPAIEAES